MTVAFGVASADSGYPSGCRGMCRAGVASTNETCRVNRRDDVVMATAPRRDRHTPPIGGVVAASRRSEGEDLLAFHLRAMRLPEPSVEYQFHHVRRWRFDFAWPDRLIAVEIEGGTYASGRHSRGAGFEADCVKYAEAAIAGWRVIRVTTGMVESGQAIALIDRALR
jgi:very-short-patch-repair endonuclease